MRIFVDLEKNGKAERQKGHDTFISTHTLDDVGRVRSLVKNSRLMVRVNPLRSDHPAASRAEVDAVINRGADLLMLPMFSTAAELKAFAEIVAGRVPLVPLLETAGALQTLDEWIDTPGIFEVFVGLNDLHLSLGCRFMFEPLLMGHVDRVASVAKSRGLRFGFGGIARMAQGALAGKAVLAEHIRLGSSAVILSRTFNRADADPGNVSFENAVAELRLAERQLKTRALQDVEDDRQRTAAIIAKLAKQAVKATDAP